MEKIQAFLKVSFRAKVLVPIVATMVALLMITVWLVNRRITEQFRVDAARSLASADSALKKSQHLRRNELLLRYHNLPKEPRYKAAFQTLEPDTLNNLLAGLRGEHGLDVMLFAINNSEALASAKRDPSISLSRFEAAGREALTQALEGEERVDTVRVDDRLFDIVCVPVFGTGDHLLGALMFGAEIGSATAQDWRDITQCQIVLFASGHPVASTLARPELNQQFAHLFTELAGSIQLGHPRDVFLAGEHYFCSAGTFDSLARDGSLGWLLLSSYEQPLRALEKTQQMLFLVISLGILVGTAMVWWLVHRVTQPLRDLRDSAEAVGKGDFTRRVEVVSGDECGELAFVFNQMTENLQRSREQLERTVDTLKTTQDQLVQSEKLSGIGEFVAGVAHELNNPLTSVMGFAELLGRADANPQHKRHLDMIQKSALRCQKIVQSLLSFSRRHAPERKLSSVNELIENAVEFLAYQLRTSNIEVITKLDPNIPKAMVDPHQLQQVFLNIVNNARQAIEAHQPKGQIRVTSETCGQAIRVSFTDNGPGIREENLSKVFDPFFTTKDVGKGTGLGLSLCYGIIREHGGTITARSKPGEGATFFIELPLATAAAACGSAKSATSSALAAGAPAPALALPPSNIREGVGKKVLVIDDEEAILEMVRETLSQSGYQVDIASDGEVALNRLRQNSYDLALCDWKMPGLNGQQVYERIRAANPALSDRMIFITGDVVNEKTQKFLAERQKLCLSKPFSLVEFREAISKALANG